MTPIISAVGITKKLRRLFTLRTQTVRGNRPDQDSNQRRDRIRLLWAVRSIFVDEAMRQLCEESPSPATSALSGSNSECFGTPNFLGIFKTRRDISRPMRFLMDFFGRCVTWIRGRNVFTDLFCAFRFSFFTTSAYLCIVTLILGQQSSSRMAWGSVDSILG